MLSSGGREADIYVAGTPHPEINNCYVSDDDNNNTNLIITLTKKVTIPR